MKLENTYNTLDNLLEARFCAVRSWTSVFEQLNLPAYADSERQ